MRIKINSNSRLKSCIPIGYPRTMDEVDIYIEDNLKNNQRVTPVMQQNFYEKVLVCFDVSMALRKMEDAEYYRELLSKITRTYGH